MKKFEEKKFSLPELQGISDKNIEEHLKLYAGYVKNANLILEHMDELSKDSEKYIYELGELQRRFSFEFGGMRNHEYYFSSFEGGYHNIDTSGPLYGAIAQEFDMFDHWLEKFKTLALTRGVGWAAVYYDKKTKRLLNGWVDEQHLGHLVSCSPVLMLDMWEHAYIVDYQPSGKKKYIEDFFANLNWQKIEENFGEAQK